jgi:serine protease Do
MISNWTRGLGLSLLLSAGALAPATLALGDIKLAAQPVSADDADVAHAQALSRAYQKVAREVTPSVVNITAKKGGDVVNPQRSRRGQQQSPQNPFGDPNMDEFMRRFFGQQNQGPYRTPEQVSGGSGIVVTNDGYILTNNHVVEDAKDISVQFKDGGIKFPAKLVGRDPASDVAVIKIEGTFPAAKLADSDALNVGEIVVAIGNPFGLGTSVTSGIVSAKGRSLSDLPSRGGAMYQDFIQTDAAINPGNSGGPLVNLRGEVVGMNTAIFSRSGGYMGIGFAIPANMAKTVMDSLISGGVVQRAWLGINMQPVTDDLAKSLNIKDTQGVLISELVENAPAQAAGLKAEDVIISVDGKPTNTVDQLRNIVASSPIGKTVEVAYLRNGEKQTTKVTLAKRPDEVASADGKDYTDDKLGISIAPVTSEVTERLRDKNAKGVVVTDVQAGSAAEMIGMQNDMIISAINGKPIESVDEFKSAMKDADLKRGVRLAVRANGRTQIATIRIDR